MQVTNHSNNIRKMKEEMLEAIYGTVERLEQKVDELSASPKNAGTETVPAILLFRNFDPHLFPFPNQIAFFQALYVGKGFLRGNGDKFSGGLVMLGQE